MASTDKTNRKVRELSSVSFPRKAMAAENIKEHPEMIEAGWEIKQPSSSSQEKWDAAGRAALTRKAKEMIAIWNQAPLPQKFVFHTVRLEDHINAGTKTKGQTLTRAKSHRAWGTARGYFLYKLQ